MHNLRDIFQQRFFALVDNHPTHPGPQFFQRLGISRTNYYSLKSTEKGSKTLPNTANLALFARELGVTPNYLLGFDGDLRIERSQPALEEIQKQAESLIQDVFRVAARRLQGADAPSLNDLICWWRSTGGKLGGPDEISPYTDLIFEPDLNAQTLVAARMGQESLASKTLTKASPARLAHFFDTLEEKVRRGIIFDYHNVHERRDRDGFHLSEHTITVDVQDLGEAFSLEYIKLMLPVTDGFGNKYVLNYSTPVD